MNFSFLESRMGAFHIFMLGGIITASGWFHWVFLFCAESAPFNTSRKPRRPQASASRHSIH